MLDLASITRQLSSQHETGDKLIEDLIDLDAQISESQITDDLLLELVDQVIDSESRLIELNQLKNRFLGIAAHDLRSPLSTILGMSEILISESELDDETQAEFHQTIHSVAGQLLTLIEELLDVSVIEAGEFVLNPTNIDLKALIEKAVHQARIVAGRKDIKLNSDLAEVSAVIDPNRMTQVVDNLISNAIKFSYPGSETTIRLTVQGDFAIVEVKDQGQGIPAAELNEMFGAYHKLSVTPTGDERSTGLGLSIVKKIVEAHNGTINVESTEGEGSSFFVILPLKQAADV